MKLLTRILVVLLLVIIVAAAAGMIYLNHIKTRSVPDYNNGVDLEHLSGEVTVYRDSFGIPHVYAGNEADLYRTVGYLMAQDRLWQMDLMRRITTGRLAEVLDPGLVDTDQLFRALDFTGKSELVMGKTDPGYVENVEAFTDGINQYIDRHREKLPFEFVVLGYEPDPWEVTHSFNMIGYMSWSLTFGWGLESTLYRLQQVLTDTLLRELLPDPKFHKTPVFPGYMTADKEMELELQSHLDEAISVVEELGLRVFEGSSNWAVSGKKSKTGLPLMSNDMHQDLMAPGIWYQMHQVVEGKLNVTGVALPGVPYIICGHNEDIAWGMSNVMVDDTDFYLETINPCDSNQYLLDGRWKEMKLVEEEIRVKGLDEPVTRINRYTHRGPVVSRFTGIGERVISMRWQGNAFSDEGRSIYLLNRAGNWEEFRDALCTFTSIGQNVVYADRFGNIGLQTAAGIPIRREGGIFVYPGDTSYYDWIGVVPFEELPFIYNPESGHVSSANNRTVGDDYPYYIGSWFVLPFRIDRIREMLEELEVLDTEYFKKMLRDQVSHQARKMTPVYLEALEDHTEGIYSAAHQLLEHWDYDMAASSPAAMIYEFLWLELIDAMFRDELGEDLFPLMYNNYILADNLINRVRVTGESSWCDDISTAERKETFHDNIRSAFRQTVDTLASLYGNEPDQWKWGEVHKVALIHPLGTVPVLDRLFHINSEPYPVGGSYHTVCPYLYPQGTSFISAYGASQRHIFNTADWDASLTVIPTGTSGVPASDHYLDQTELYVNNRYHRDHFSREAVEANMKYRAVFK